MNKCKTSAESNVLSRLHAMKREQNTPNCCTDSCQMFFINNRQIYKAFTQNTCSSQSTIIMFIKQWSDVWAPSKLKATFLWKDQFELIFHARLLKTNRLSSFMTKSLRNFFEAISEPSKKIPSTKIQIAPQQNVSWVIWS